LFINVSDATIFTNHTDKSIPQGDEKFMKHGAVLIPLSLSAFIGLIVGCSGGSSSPVAATQTISASKPSTAISAVSDAVSVAGTSMGASGISAAFVRGGPVFHPSDITQDCSIHAEPERAGVVITSSDPDYPGKFMYCKLAYNTQDEESVQGAFAQIKSISCMLENAGLVFDGQAHSYTVTIDSTCWSATQLAQMGGGGSTMTLSVTGTTPAAFNTYYDHGVAMAVPSVGNVQLATKVSGTKVEFMESETVTANSKYGSYAASLDYSTGDLRYELREDRYNDGADGSSGGFTRHQRIYAKVTTSGQTVTGLTSVSAAQAEAYNGDNGQGGFGGQAVTASGNLVTGIKARFWAPNGAAGTSDLTNASNWIETTNTRCYTSSGPTGGGCSAGIAIPTANAADNFPFALIGASYTNSLTWADALGAMTFTTVDPTQDTQ
jgi:hypothetical protein